MNRLYVLLICSCLALAPAAMAQTDDLRLPVIIDADSTDYDGRTSMLMFSGLRLTQGSIGIKADTAHASRMDFDDSVWKFSGNVVFDVEAGHVTCDTADLEFADFQLLVASIEGSPATFEIKRPGGEDSTYAEASRLHYDVAAGTIEFSGGATITEGGNKISSETLVYNISEQRINASGNGGDRVNVIYTPPEATTEPPSEAAAEPAPEAAAEPPPEDDNGDGPETTDQDTNGGDDPE